MAYLRPPSFARRIFNPIAKKLGIGGSATLAVAGRTSGETQTVPVIPVEHDGARYIVSTRGESEWVRNLRKAGKGELRRKGTTEAVRATEIPTPERTPILDEYRKVAGKTVATYFKKLPDAADHPTFRIEPD